MSHAPSSSHGSSGHETRDVTFKPIVWASLGAIVLVVVVFALMRGTLKTFGSNEVRSSPRANPLAASLGRVEAPEPRLQTNPVRDLAVMREGEESVLESYAWVDKSRGIVRLPIERAMELVAQRGLAHRTTQEAGE